MAAEAATRASRPLIASPCLETGSTMVPPRGVELRVQSCHWRFDARKRPIDMAATPAQAKRHGHGMEPQAKVG